MTTTLVTLSNFPEPALVDQQSLDDLEEAGIYGNWFINDDGHGNMFVRIKHGGTVVSVARLITKAQRGERATFKNGNRFDLRLSNLKVVKIGGSN